LNPVELSNAIRNTGLICVATMAVAVPTGTLLAILLRRTDVLFRRWAWLAIGSQLAIPLYAFAGCWNAGFGSQGWWPLSQVVAVRFQTSAVLAVVFIHAVGSIPWVCFIMSCGLLGSHRSLEENAYAEEGNWGILRRTITPNLGGWIALSCFWVCVPILTEMVVTNLYQVQTVAERVYLDASRGLINGLTYPVAVLLCVLPVVTFAWILGKRLPHWPDVVARARQHEARMLACGLWRIPISALAWLIVAVLVGLPIFNLLIKAGWHPYAASDGLTHYGWTVNRFITTIEESCTLFLSEFYWSGVLAVVAATLALVTAIALSSMADQRWHRGVIYLLMLTLICFRWIYCMTTLSPHQSSPNNFACCRLHGLCRNPF
jgi:iron(III) transport system permease protein